MLTVSDLESYFKTVELPKEVKLNDWETIVDVPKFINNSISMLRANSGNRIFMPCYERLLALRNILENDTKRINKSDS